MKVFVQKFADFVKEPYGVGFRQSPAWPGELVLFGGPGSTG